MWTEKMNQVKACLLLRECDNLQESALIRLFVDARYVNTCLQVAADHVSDDEAADDFPEELEARIALLYANLAPIVQDVPGAHWDYEPAVQMLHQEDCPLLWQENVLGIFSWSQSIENSQDSQSFCCRGLHGLISL
jgi:hypothetical protein